jgi:hypothetical protein
MYQPQRPNKTTVWCNRESGPWQMVYDAMALDAALVPLYHFRHIHHYPDRKSGLTEIFDTLGRGDTCILRYRYGYLLM